MTFYHYENAGEDISGTGTIAEFDPHSYGFVEVQLENGGASADYELQIGVGGNWYTGYTWTGVTSIDETLELVAPRVRLQITSGAGGSNTGDVLVVFDGVE